MYLVEQSGRRVTNQLHDHRIPREQAIETLSVSCLKYGGNSPPGEMEASFGLFRRRGF
jgi:hypothetical protein